MNADITALGLRFYHQKEALSLAQLWQRLKAEPNKWRVEKMRHPKVADPKPSKPPNSKQAKRSKIDDRSRIAYNSHILLAGIPEQAYDYVVNGKSAICWVMERQAVCRHKESGISNDANDYATETIKNPAYPLLLLLRIVLLSLKTQELVGKLE